MSKLSREQTIEYDKKYYQHPWLKGNTEPITNEKAEGIMDRNITISRVSCPALISDMEIKMSYRQSMIR